MTAITRLDTEETKHIRTFPDNYRQYKGHFHAAELQATMDLYQSDLLPTPERSLLALQNCSSFAWFVRHTETGEVRVHSSKCRQRWCPLCAQTLANWRTMSLIDYVGTLDRPKFITLTLKHSNAPLKQQINDLYDAFKKLRKLKLMVKTIHGGVWFFQVKRSKSDGLWHPHLHIVADSDYIPKNQLSQAWLSITHTSKIVDVRVIRNPSQTARYVARYSARPANLAELPPNRRVEVILSLAGRRLCGTWGTARSVSLKPPLSNDRDKWVNLGNWTLVINCQTVSAVARSILRAWKTSSPLPEDCTLVSVERQLDHAGFSDSPETYSDTIPKDRSPPWQQLTFVNIQELYATPNFALANSDKPLQKYP